jgi:hypothetical protein
MPTEGSPHRSQSSVCYRLVFEEPWKKAVSVSSRETTSPQKPTLQFNLTLPKDVFCYRGLLSNLLAFCDRGYDGEKLQRVKKKKSRSSVRKKKKDRKGKGK